MSTVQLATWFAFALVLLLRLALLVVVVAVVIGIVRIVREPRYNPDEAKDHPFAHASGK